MEEPVRRRVAVVGGGMAGLAAAYALTNARPDLDVIVFEGSGQVGGKLRLGEVAGVTVDLGAESMLNRRPEATSLVRAVGLGDDLVHPVSTQAGVWTRNAIRPLPPTMLGIPTDLAAAARSGVITPSQVRRAKLERWLPRLDVTADVGVGEVVARRLGRAVRDRLVEPLLGGVYAGRADELSLHACLPQVTQALGDHGGLLSAVAALAPRPTAGAPSRRPAPGPVFAGIAGGVARLPHQLAHDLTHRGVDVRRNAVVRELVPMTGGRWRLVVGPSRSATVEHADAVVLACPAGAAARLLTKAVPVASRELGQVEYASMALVTLALETAELNAELVGSGLLVPPVDGRVIKASTFSSRKWSWLAGDTTIVRCSVGRHGDEAVLRRDDDELVAAAASDLREAVGLDSPLVDALVTRWGGALPQYAVGHLDRVSRVQAAASGVRGLELCGAVFEGVGIPAVIASGQAAATRVLAALDPAPTMTP
ncbi:MAG: protoporphyrinogen oxidase [Nocardioidaceae bacterium]